MKIWKIAALACLLAVLLGAAPATRAQNPQTSDVSSTPPVVGVNANWTNGIAPGYWPTAGSGLTLDLGKGTSFCAAAIVTYSGGALTLADNSVNYVFLDTAADCAPASNTSGFTSTSIPLATVTTSSGSITDIVDDRTPFMQGASSAGSGINSLNGLIGSAQSFATGAAGTDFNIVSSGTTHTFNLPDASATARGALTSADWSAFNAKLGIHGSLTAGDCLEAYDASSVQDAGSACGTTSGSGLFSSFQIGTETPFTGSGKYFQLVMGAGLSYTLTGSGTSSSPYVATVNASGNASQIQSIPVSATAPTDGQTLVYNAGAGEYEPSSPAGYQVVNGPYNYLNAGAYISVYATDRIDLIMVNLPAMSLHDVALIVGTTDSSGLYSVGLYDMSGSLVASTSPASLPTAGPVALSFSGSPVSISPGTYLLAITGNATTATFRYYGGNGTLQLLSTFYPAETSTGGALPSIITVPSLAPTDGGVVTKFATLAWSIY